MIAMDALFVIESLRSGIPTRRSTTILPDLRQEISARIVDDLQRLSEDETVSGRMIWGQYGQGKTHALTTLEHLALERNFAVSRVTLSREVSCHDLLAFYREAAAKIRTPDSTIDGMAQHLAKLPPEKVMNATLFQSNRYEHTLPLTVLESYLFSEGESKEKLYADLMGNRLPISEVKSLFKQVRGQRVEIPRFVVAEHARAYVALMADLIQLCGFEGWVILIDEAELIGRLGRLSRLKAYRNLIWLLNWHDGAKQQALYGLVAAATRLQDDLWYGRKNEDRTVMPELAAARAMQNPGTARKEMEDFFSRAISADALHIRPARPMELRALIEEVVALHGVAYAWNAHLDSDALMRELGTQPVRTYIRAALEALDIDFLYGMEQIPASLGYDQAALVEAQEELPTSNDDDF